MVTSSPPPVSARCARRSNNSAPCSGCPLSSSAPEQYHLPKEALFRFIEQHSAPDVGPSKLRNTKNNIRWLLDLAVQRRLAPPYGWRHLHVAHAIQKSRAATLPHQNRWQSVISTACTPCCCQPLSRRMETTSQFRPYQLRQRQGLQVAPQVFLRRDQGIHGLVPKSLCPRS